MRLWISVTGGHPCTASHTSNILREELTARPPAPDRYNINTVVCSSPVLQLAAPFPNDIKYNSQYGFIDEFAPMSLNLVTNRKHHVVSYTKRVVLMILSRSTITHSSFFLFRSKYGLYSNVINSRLYILE